MIDNTLCVVDHGLFAELAIRLARDFKRVLYFVPWTAEFPLIGDRLLGFGLDNIERIEDPYVPSVIDEVDTYVFPDIFDGGIQELLARQGKAVWGSREGDSLETRRVWFREWQAENGMPVRSWMFVSHYDDAAMR